jgi:hypothetical protein
VRWSGYWHIPRHRFLVGLCLELRLAIIPQTKKCTAAMGYCMATHHDTGVRMSPQPPQDGRRATYVPASHNNMALGEAQLTSTTTQASRFQTRRFPDYTGAITWCREQALLLLSLPLSRVPPNRKSTPSCDQTVPRMIPIGPGMIPRMIPSNDSQILRRFCVANFDESKQPGPAPGAGPATGLEASCVVCLACPVRQ